jgi:hypothetical protein
MTMSKVDFVLFMLGVVLGHLNGAFIAILVIRHRTQPMTKVGSPE